MSVNTKMTAIADKIRGLLGLTGTMGLDAMATHLGTEQANITAALTALGGKGVTVPSGANSDNLAELIGAIGSGGAMITNGAITPSNNIIFADYLDEYGEPIAHGLGVEPIIFLLYTETYKTTGNACNFYCGYKKDGIGSVVYYYYLAGHEVKQHPGYVADKTNVYLNNGGGLSGSGVIIQLLSGITYRWIAVG